jgi:4-hydroxyphenylpyruvate dioxygenase
MSKVESLGIKTIESVSYYVHDLERSRRFYTQLLDFQEIGRSGQDIESAGRQQCSVFKAGACVLIVSQPRGVAAPGATSASTPTAWVR